MRQAARNLIGCCAAGCIALLATASAREPVDTPGQVDAAAASPSKLDYLVLASMMDAPSLMGLSVSRAAQSP